MRILCVYFDLYKKDSLSRFWKSFLFLFYFHSTSNNNLIHSSQLLFLSTLITVHFTDLPF